jgi:hypothetical protein
MSQMDNKPSQPGPNMNINMNNMAMGGTPGMEHGAAPRNAAGDGRIILNTYIYDYFCKNNMFECANALLKTPDADVQLDGNYRSPSRRPQKHENDGNAMNGIDDEPMDGSDQRQGDDGEEPKSVKDLPPAKVPSIPSGSSFLCDWWCCFMDIYWARSKSPGASNAANAYVNQTQVCHLSVAKDCHLLTQNLDASATSHRTASPNEPPESSGFYGSTDEYARRIPCSDDCSRNERRDARQSRNGWRPRGHA